MQNFYSSTNLIGSGGLNADDIKMLKDSTNCVVDSSKKIFGRAHQGQKVDTCLNGPGLVDNINAEDAGCLFGDPQFPPNSSTIGTRAVRERWGRPPARHSLVKDGFEAAPGLGAVAEYRRHRLRKDGVSASRGRNSPRHTGGGAEFASASLLLATSY